MTTRRWIASLVMLALLGVLVTWARSRERQMQACLDEGRTWNGSQSRCELQHFGPILRRAIERS